MRLYITTVILLSMATSGEAVKSCWDARLVWEPYYVRINERAPVDVDAAAEGAERKIAECSIRTKGPEKLLEKFRVVKVWSCLVEVFREGCEPVRFRINYPKSGGITFTDTPECETGIAGTTGLWGTRPPMRVARPRSLTPNAFKVEAARLIGKERAEQILLELRQDHFS
jgi:hypothetical protein